MKQNLVAAKANTVEDQPIDDNVNKYMNSAVEPLHEELSFFASKQNKWRKIYLGKFVVVKGKELIGVFDKPEAALVEGATKFGSDPFLVRPIGPTKEEENFYIPVLALGLLGLQCISAYPSFPN